MRPNAKVYLLLVGWFWVQGLLAQTASLPVLTNGVVVALDFDGDGVSDVNYTQDFYVTSNPGQWPRGGDAAFVLRPQAGNDILTATRQAVSFRFGDLIGPTNEIWRGSYINESYLTLTLFWQFQEFQGASWGYVERRQHPLDYLAELTEALIGVRVVKSPPGTTHYGWVKVVRSDGLFTKPFQVVAHEWSPWPDQPIRAGVPVEIPLKPIVALDGLRLRWPLELAHWRLEVADQLGETATWRPVPEAVGPEALLAVPEKSQFYRIRKPE